ncbi:MAG: hypothetical protein VYE81_00250 [Planctomycetota bacterium]|nr:hypothetical protein [Planctomycetota bacterium]
MRTLHLACLPLSFCSLVYAGELHVPGDHADLQSAIDAAASGDTIIVHGGTHAPITITKPLSILGDPAPLIVGDTTDTVLGTYRGPISLSGPGAGRVTLGRIETGGVTEGHIFGASAPGISGGGFDSLVVYDSTVRAPGWIFLTGVADGQPGIQVSVPDVYIERSLVEGSASDTDDCYSFGPDGPLGLSAPGSVSVFDSTVRGGAAGASYYCLPGPFCGCPPSGVGGAGIVAGTLLHSNSTIEGGDGATWQDSDGNLCCVQASWQPAVVGAEIALAGLAGSGAFTLSQSYTLDSPSATTPSLLLLFSLGLGSPIELPGLGWAFLDLGSFGSLGLPTFPLTFTMGTNPGLVGAELAFQGFDLVSSALSRPVSGVILP